MKVKPADGTPRPTSIEGYRPGGTIAKTATLYTAIPASACVAGTWTPATPASVTGVVYVPCAVNLKVAGRYAATIAAEGTITVSSHSITVGQGSAAPGAAALISGAAGTSINILASDIIVLGQTVGTGAVRTVGARANLTCGAVGSTISIAGADSSATMASWCVSR